jgi:hypothetical protein
VAARLALGFAGVFGVLVVALEVWVVRLGGVGPGGNGLLVGILV